MRTLRGLSFVLRAARQLVADVNPLDDEHLVLDLDLAFRLRRQPPPARIDPARLQRATQGAGESTRSRGDDVVESRSVLGILTGRRAVVLTDLVVGAEEDGLGLDGEKGTADRASVADDPNSRHVGGLVLAHADSLRRAQKTLNQTGPFPSLKATASRYTLQT